MPISPLGRIVKKKRQQFGWSQFDLAKYSGVSRTTIAFLESGSRADLLFSNVAKLAKTLRFSLDDVSNYPSSNIRI